MVQEGKLSLPNPKKNKKPLMDCKKKKKKKTSGGEGALALSSHDVKLTALKSVHVLQYLWDGAKQLHSK